MARVRGLVWPELQRLCACAGWGGGGAFTESLEVTQKGSYVVSRHNVSHTVPAPMECGSG